MGKYIQRDGNLFDSEADALGHGVNTAGLMGAGIAVEFKHRYPDMYLEYKALCRDDMLVPGDCYWYGAGDKCILNLATQDRPGRFAKLEWVELAFSQALFRCRELEIDTLALPRIGCGIGGLSWLDVDDILEYYTRTEGPTNVEVWSL